jgi:hypothetical protein
VLHRLKDGTEGVEDNKSKLCNEWVEIWVSRKVSVITRQYVSCRSTGSLKKTWNSKLVFESLSITEKKKFNNACYWTISEILVFWKSKNALVLAKYIYTNVWWWVMTHRQDKTQWPTNCLSWNCMLTVNSWSWPIETACQYGVLTYLFRNSQRQNWCKTDSNCEMCKVTQVSKLYNKQ